MSPRKHKLAKKKNLFQKIWKLHSVLFKWLIKSFLRTMLVLGRQVRLSKSGFVMPTVAMVTLVVILLTTAIMLRSFDRSKSANNIRVNQAVLSAATPALDRARAKIDALLNDQRLPRATPCDIALYQAINSTGYTLSDETRLKLVYDINGDNSIQTNSTTIENNETLTTAWKFPVDTDNNGKFDSYTLYGIYFRSPSRSTDGKFARARNPLEARTPPMNATTLGTQCASASGSSASLVGNSSWYKVGAKLKKSFFVYTATVPITTPPTGDNKYESYQGTKGFSALELQQDRSRISLTNNTVVFQDDLEISPGASFNLNGRIFTNANLLVGGHGGAVRLYQVSSKNSCFYEEDNSKIAAGGNVGTGNLGDTSDQTAVTVDLYNGFGNDPGTATIDGNNRSTTSPGGSQVGYNDAAYNRRIALMKQTAISYHPGYDNSTKKITPVPTITSVAAVTQYPQEVIDGFKVKINAPGGSSLDTQQVLADQIELYLKNRTRRVPYAEVASADGTGALGTYDADGDYVDTSVFTSSPIEPPAVWREPTDANTGLTLNTANLQQTQPEKQKKDGKETYLGDRVYVGNNLPAFWKKDGQYVTGSDSVQYIGNNINWTNPNDQPRYRTTQVVALPDLGISERDGYWEDAAAKQVSGTEPNVGGLRVITGAGIYRNDSSTIAAISSASFIPKSTGLDSGGTIPNAPLLAGDTTASQYKLVWSDLMPMSGGIDDPSTTTVNESTAPPDLRMRATAVYHYNNNAGTSQTPIACVSSYYDPTNATTAKNKVNVDGGYGIDTTNGRSNNGVVYAAPYTSDTARSTAIASYITELKAQAKLMFPNGRIVNESLQKALQKLNASGGLADTNKPLSLSENSAIDTAICALKILDNTIGSPSNTIIPHGAIKEATFLNAREVKAIEGTDANPINSDLALEQRQPLEIRVTDINFNTDNTKGITKKSIGTSPTGANEYLLPNSGIIYASRDDALLDLSNNAPNSYTDANNQTSKLLSPTDFILDPTRRSNGIRLINGNNLAREDNFRQDEKGLILVTNLPAYIKGNFNLHQQPGTSTATEEFMETLDNSWGNFYSRANNLNNNFACRQGQTNCGSNGDQWRPATIISDAISLQSDTYKDGFRNQGDFDLNNNAGSSATDARKKNGFWDNNFVTSALWWDTGNTDNAIPDEKTTDSYIGSYLTNGVSPIQRRLNFPEYIMEICRKIPVSTCGSSDWFIGYDLNGDGDLEDPIVGSINEKNLKAKDLVTPALITLIGTLDKTRLGAGTTAKAALVPADQRYPRRVAFRRNSYNELALTSFAPSIATPQPLGVGCPLTGCIYPNGITALQNVNYPTPANNALWFRTTKNTNGRPYCQGNNDPADSGCTSNDISYANNLPLYYLPPELGGEKMILPATPDISGVPSLNLPSGTQSGSDYTVCFGSGGGSSASSQVYQPPTPFSSGSCPSATATAIGNFLGGGGANGLLDLSTTTSALPASGGTVNATSNLNVIPISDFNNDAVITLNANNNPNAIFVLQAGSSLSFGANCNDDTGVTCKNGVTLVLNGVSPNNVFWAVKGAIKFQNVNAVIPHRLAGNFIGKAAVSILGANTNIDGGRILGFSNIAKYGNAGINLTAVTSDGQPSLVPVLQVHNTDDSPGNNLNIGGILDRWKQSASSNIFNAAFVSGNSPSRPGEDMAGLHNFVRFMEKWTGTVNIKGSFIQFKRSAYATAPFAQKRNGTDSGNMSIFGLNLNSTPGGNLPYYNPPTRQWGFDVALLSQSPDLFAQRFTQQSTNNPDEFFREISQDDVWVQTLLCSAQASDLIGGSGATFTTAAIPDRPSNCPVNLPYPANP